MNLLEPTRARERFDLLIQDASLMDVVVQRVAEGETLQQLAEVWTVPYGRLAKWVADDDGRRGQYEGALMLRADLEAQKAIEIADEATPEDVAVRKLRTDVRLKLAGKWDRKRYGERVEDGSAQLVGALASAILEGQRRLSEAESARQPEKVLAPIDGAFDVLP